MRRSLAIIIAFSFLLSTFVPFAFADYSSEPVSLWDYYMYQWSHQGDPFSFSIGPLSISGEKLGSKMAHTLDPSVICSGSSDHLHHAQSVISGSFASDSHGNYVLCECKDCGTRFKCYSEDVEDGYNDTVHDNNLDNGSSYAPSGSSGHWREDCPYLVRGPFSGAVCYLDVFPISVEKSRLANGAY